MARTQRVFTMNHLSNSKLRIGYQFFGFLGDHKYDQLGNPTSTPDGNATYSWALIDAMQAAGHTVLPMMYDRDAPGWEQHRADLFAAFAQPQRGAVYSKLCGIGNKERSYWGFPQLDVLLLEWRFPIPGRNTAADMMSYGYQPDLARQTELLNYYKDKKTRIIFWDLDHKLTYDDEQRWLPNAVFETAVKPRKLFEERVRIEPPMNSNAVIESAIRYAKDPDRKKLIAYIGSRYERDDVIDEWIHLQDQDDHHGSTHFYGKWDDEAKRRWPEITYHDRITTSEFSRAYCDASIVPLLAKRSYMENGFITPRPFEALMFGSIPIGLKGHLGIDSYCDSVANDRDDLYDIANYFSEFKRLARLKFIKRLVEKLSFMEARNFVREIEKVAR